ncbi:HAUS augmin-like complex subunit 6 [Sciurus carolinensis]|uniref:HAUS augmin-like complex subunit 6 n=1 Tax=Sciurus carolinensis TaxID=30640 RepID=A0AA41MEK4_SCICA|nr:HAUS augmin-like complex subunit 6 [Sciurus carolinensis]
MVATICNQICGYCDSGFPGNSGQQVICWWSLFGLQANGGQSAVGRLAVGDRMEPCDDDSNIQEKIKKVRSLWTSVNETLLVLEKEREVVSSVLSLVNQYALDGTNVIINIPRLLLDKIEKQVCQLHIGNVYEAGNLNLLTVIQLLNEVLKIMKYERCQTDQARLTIDLHYLEKETKLQRERLSDLKHMRYKIKDDLTTIRHSVIKKQGEWCKKWEEFLGLSPFSLIKDSTPNKLPFDDRDELSEIVTDRYGAYSFFKILRHISPASFLLQPTSSSDRNSSTLLEKDMEMRIPKEKNETISKKIPEFKVKDSSLLDTAKTTETRALEVSLAPPKSDPFQKEQDHLVEEVARAVLSDSPQLSEGKEVKLEELIDSLVSNPFLTRKQIPRTPENLITEIRSSWRKAIEVEENRSTEPIQVDTEHGEVLSGSLPVLHNQEFSMASFFSDFDHSHLAEEKVSCCLKDMPQKHVTSHKAESPVEDQSDLLNKKIICKQDLECTALPTKLSKTSQIEIFSPTVGNRIEVKGRNEEEYIKILDCSQASYNEPSTHKTMLWNSFQLSSGISSKSLKDADFGILHETLPEEVGHLSLNSSSSSEANFKLEPNSPVYSDIFPDDVGRQTTSESDFNLQASSSSYGTLKKYLSKKREESYLFNPEALERHKPESSPSPKNMEADDMLNFLDTDDLLIDYTKPSLRISLGERKRSLSPLIKFSPVEQKLKSTVPYSLGELLPNIKEKEILNQSLDVKESDLSK